MELGKIAGGALQELFARAYKKALVNLKDPNTSWKDARKIVITLTFRGNEARNKADMDIRVDTKLANTKPIESMIVFDSDPKSGDVLSKELTDGIVAPPDLGGSDDPEQNAGNGPKTIAQFRKEA